MSNILYLSTAPPPALPGTDAVFQDIERLQVHFGGTFLSLYPLKKPSRFVPPWLMGMHNRRRLKDALGKADLVHVFHAMLQPLPCLSGYAGPIVYSVTASAGTSPCKSWFDRHGVRIVTSHERDRDHLQNLGFRRVACIRPGLETSRLTYSPPPDGSFTLMVGSAPWTKAQFRTKGVDALLEVMRRVEDLHVVFLWRRLLHDELLRRIRMAGLEDRATVINERVDVNDVLVRCHAAVVLAAHERIVKAWPHSAIESLAAGKPVMLSRVIPMADFVETNQAGVVVDGVGVESLLAAVDSLKRGYAHMAGRRLTELAQREFSLDGMISRYREVYDSPDLKP